MGETTRNRVTRGRTRQLRRQGRLVRLVGAVKSSRQGGRERFGEMAIVLFIRCHSCGAVAGDGIARHRRLVSMMAQGTSKRIKRRSSELEGFVGCGGES